jgi:hypothetical protein
MEGVNINIDSHINNTRGFEYCANLTNCTIILRTSQVERGNCVGFNSCTNLTGCTAKTTTNSINQYYGNSQAFYGCTTLFGCTATAINNDGGGASEGFQSCIDLIGCTGTGTGTGNSYGFVGCKGMLLNKPGAASTTGTYLSCYASLSGASGSAVADTAAGGWNVA